MKLSEFDFDLPEHLIATRPVQPRSASRLLVATPDAIADQHMFDLPRHLRPGDRLVLNDTKVLPARLSGMRWRDTPQGRVCAKIEVTLLDPLPAGQWRALLKPLRKVKPGEVIHFNDGFNAALTSKTDGTATLQFNLKGAKFDRALQIDGVMPLPPYIAAQRDADARDHDDYQTIWARNAGAVAAPTASLHFDAALMADLAATGVGVTKVTLHVGAGTFLPVKVDDIAKHKMHAERGQISARAADEINQTRTAGGRIIPVGTTALRLIETATDGQGTTHPWQGATDIFITPGYEFRAADALITNFHLPKSTLMMLVSAFIGQDRVRAIYAHAIANNYRFYSYGDASLLLPQARSRPG